MLGDAWLVLAVACLALALGGCASSLLERAVRARGGALESLYREVDSEVYEGFPGRWSWETAYRFPGLLRWTIHTYGEDQSFAFDGTAVTLSLGSAILPVDATAAASFRTQARWFAVGALDPLADPARVDCRELAPGALPRRFRPESPTA